ncbi:hypothetical protein [Ensifer sp. LCM 4579]|uniref:hypothetical protein n=1 Tax=Ensifer sp. LCM 4579 TaxID=1848292 RepID=UPI0008D903B9|nr:hypothetical protein [Ensifer sp. LCM 4579]OHV73355.1 hypothetical protein LCM4579_10565 [Ensifer sp. LCM 4579]
MSRLPAARVIHLEPMIKEPPRIGADPYFIHRALGVSAFFLVLAVFILCKRLAELDALIKAATV